MLWKLVAGVLALVFAGLLYASSTGYGYVDPREVDDDEYVSSGVHYYGMGSSRIGSRDGPSVRGGGISGGK